MEPTTNQAEGYKATQLILAFLGGAALGALTAIFTTPKRGPELRADITGFLKESRDRTKQLPTAVKTAADAARHAFTDSVHHS